MKSTNSSLLYTIDILVIYFDVLQLYNIAPQKINYSLIVELS